MEVDEEYADDCGGTPCGALKSLVSDFQIQLQEVVQDVERQLHELRRENAELEGMNGQSLTVGAPVSLNKKVATSSEKRCPEEIDLDAYAEKFVAQTQASFEATNNPSLMQSGAFHSSNSEAKDDVGRKSTASNAPLKTWRLYSVYQEKEVLKEEVVNNALRQYDVTDFYWTTGIFQRIARSHHLEIITLSVVFVNAIWIAVDVDVNGSTPQNEKPLFYQLVQFAFFAYFCTELLTRFFAFRRKSDCVKDSWFDLDALLLLLMVVDELLDRLPTVETGFNTSFVRMARLVKMLKMARIVKILRQWPELLVFIRGIGIALRSVASSFVLMAFLVYVFAVTFRFLILDSPVEEKYFSTTLMSMKWLVLIATMPDAIDSIEEIGAVSVFQGMLLFLFIGIASLTLLNMLIGVLCEVLSSVSGVERQSVKHHMMKEHLQKVFSAFGISVDKHNMVMLTREKFRAMLVDPESAKGMRLHNVDPVVLVDFIEYIFDELALHSPNGFKCGISFTKLVELMCSLGGASNNASVKDVAELRQVVRRSFAEVQRALHAHADHASAQSHLLPISDSNGNMSRTACGNGTHLPSRSVIDVVRHGCQDKAVEKYEL